MYWRYFLGYLLLMFPLALIGVGIWTSMIGEFNLAAFLKGLIGGLLAVGMGLPLIRKAKIIRVSR
ncbi:hypothetical protein LCGC14_1484440 [marine sediment metagenome]|uniref:Uncharacterized protein n=1 Tax=marine sediment metagenome TaxID=412755 RepID=A0A0F9J8I5_9ZZZZ